MLIVGLTGNIATGKSTVSLILQSPPYLLPVIDTDILACKVVELGTTAFNRILKTFGYELALHDNTGTIIGLDRTALGK